MTAHAAARTWLRAAGDDLVSPPAPELVASPTAPSAVRVTSITSGGEPVDPSALLAERFPALLSDLGGDATGVYYRLVSQAEAINERKGRPFLPGPDPVARGFVVGTARRDWRLVGGPGPGSGRHQRGVFDMLAVKLAAQMERRARDRAANRREVPSTSASLDGGLSVAALPGSSLRTWRGLPATNDDPAEAVVIRLEAVRVIRHIKKSLRSEAQRAFLEKLEVRPDLASSLGVHGEGAFLARELGLSQTNVRQLLSRIRATLAALDFDDAA